jgi:DNA polymerase (family 10)
MLDWVIVSLHSRLDQPPEVATARVLKALAHPRVCAMAHPTGRMIGSREPSAFDMERVLARAAELSVAMEINSQPDRLDLRDAHARLAREKGVRMVIDTDAHSVGQLEYVRYGVFTARRAGLTRDDVLNTLPYERFMERVRRPGRSGANAAVAKPARPKRAAAKPPARAGVRSSGRARPGARSGTRGKSR